MFLKPFQNRKDEEELMDLPSTTREEFTQALHDIRWVNQNLGGVRTLMEEVIRLLPEKNGVTRILDLGTGSADIPMALAEWARRHKREFRITAVDLHPVAVEVSRKLAGEFPEIEVRQADALHMGAPDEAFDIVISSLFMHHLKTPDAVRLLQEMARMARIGFVVNDLERHPLAYWSIRVLGRLTGKGKIFLNDAPLSVLRGFTQDDLQDLKKLSGLNTLEIRRRKPYRWTLVWRRSAEK